MNTSSAKYAPEIQERQHWISILSRSNAQELLEHWERYKSDVTYQLLRQPETGLVMTRARAGGVGQQFNLGEVTVTRCSVKLPSAEIGHSYVTGRNKAHGELAAVFDALLQNDQWQPRIMNDVIRVIEKRLSEKRETRASKVATTKVDFFTMVRGED